MSYSRPATVPDSLIRDQILAVYAGIGPDAIRPTRTQLMGSLAVGWNRVKLIHDAMAERGEIPSLKPNTGGSAMHKRAANLAISRPIKAVPVLERDQPDVPKRAPEPRPEKPTDPNRYRRPGFVRAALASEREWRSYRETLLRRIAEREREAMA